MTYLTSHRHAVLLLVLVFTGLSAGCSAPTQPRYYAEPGRQNTATPSQVVSLALRMLGRPYHYGGDAPSEGFDCSGLVFYTYHRVGLKLPRTSYGQFKASQPVAMRHLRPGDLVFFRFQRGRISHVGIYIGDHRFVHAPSDGKAVSIDDLDDPYWRYHFVRGGRTL